MECKNARCSQLWFIIEQRILKIKTQTNLTLTRNAKHPIRENI